MRILVALLVAGSIVCIALSVRAIGLRDRVGTYLSPTVDVRKQPGGHSHGEYLSAVPWMAVGALIGVLLAQGDLFISGPGRSLPGLALAGCAAGWFGHSAHRSNAVERRARRLKEELPTIVDALSLEVMSGESVVSAMRSVASDVEGVASEEFASLLVGAETEGMESALRAAARETATVEARRLYDLLAHAHAVGGRLSEALAELASDYRSALERDLTTEGGRRAVAAYGPVLALMVPTALAFLLYPTLLGLRALSGAP